MTLTQLVEGLAGLTSTGETEIEITGIHHDSRKIDAGFLFVALDGAESRGLDYVEEAIAKGAVAVVHGDSSLDLELSVPSLYAEQPRISMAEIADRFFESPSSKLKTVGITGTNGKTTTAFLLHHLMVASWRRAGMIGTVEYHDGVEAQPTSHTTPESVDLQRMLAEMQANACRGVAMEVSSHGLIQGRVDAVQFDVAVFTNLSSEHLDFHRTMDAYYEAKRLLFHQAVEGPKKAALVINADDTYGRRLIEDFSDTETELVTYGIGSKAEVRASDARYSLTGTEFKLTAAGREFLVRTPLVGAFNVYNALAALAAARGAGLNVREAVRNMATAPQVPGRLELVSRSGPFQVFVDYAHTPDALDNALRTVKALGKGKLITVFGCGGDRDTTKRAPMAAAAEEHSDVCIVTSDNPRNEGPEEIIDQVVAGFTTKKFAIVIDRRDAIREAFNLAKPGDVVVIAGKGHENYQIIGDKTIEFDDRRESRFLLRDMDLLREEKMAERRALRPRAVEDRWSGEGGGADFTEEGFSGTRGRGSRGGGRGRGDRGRSRGGYDSPPRRWEDSDS